MRKLFSPSVFIVLLFALLLVACDSPGDEAPAAGEEAAIADESADESADEGAEEVAEEKSELVQRAQEMARLRAAVEAEPQRADALLSEAGLTEEQLEALMFEIAADPVASKAYEAAVAN